jgi:phage shock protein PspC (stress-responsive transcriptional regulator)
MKKNISINISGIIFHIEEDGFETLKSYLDSINKYFSSYEDSEEIIADIESRIAEIFLEKLQEGNQIVSSEDVTALIKTMGNISDFEAIEEEADFDPVLKAKADEKSTSDNASEKSKKTKERRANKFYRDLQRKVLGGVASGVANYFNLDPLWIRVIILFIVFGLFFIPPIGGLVILAYLIMWVIIPGSHLLEEDKKLKKLYRDPDDRVIGGVSAGLAKYFNTSSINIRIIFIVLAVVFGTGIIAYIILWIITPKANSLTDKMQMKGEPVTLSNIDSNIKKSKEPTFGEKSEGTFTKVLLFPFRLIGKIFSGLGRVFAPLLLFLVAFIRVVTGLIISTTAISVIFSILTVGGVLFGLYNGNWWMWDNEFTYLPIDVFRATVPGTGILFLLVALFIPFLYLLIAGITVIAKRRVMSSAAGWSILGIWFISLLGAAASLPNFIRDLRDEGIYRVSEDFEIEADTLTIGINKISPGLFANSNFRWKGGSDWMSDGKYTSDFTDLDIQVSSNDKFKVEKRFRARGRSFEDAERNAQNLIYNYSVEDDKINFDSELTFSKDVEFRAQEVNVTFYIPEGQPFKIDSGMATLLDYFKYDFSWRDIYNSTWMYQDGNLICITCESSENLSQNSSLDQGSHTVELDTFTVVSIANDFRVIIQEGSTYAMEIEGPKNKIIPVGLKIRNGSLNIAANDFRLSEDETDELTITITAPQLKRVSVHDNAEVSIESFVLPELSINGFDNATIFIDSQIEALDVYVIDDSRLNLENRIKELNILAYKDARIYGYGAIVQAGIINMEDDVRVRINVEKELIVMAQDRSSINYKGNPRIEIRSQSNAASVSKY